MTKFTKDFKPQKPNFICSKCVLDDLVPEIWFDSEGECNYCKLHKALEKDNPNDDRGAKKISGIFDNIKEKGKNKKYDVIVGVSGGTDSSYMLHFCKINGLRPLAVHLDNGWDSEISVSNLSKILETLNIDLYTHVIDWEEFKSIQVAQLKSGLPWADAPTDLAILSILYKIAAKFGVKYIFAGNNFRTEGKQPTAWTYNDARLLKNIQRQFGIKKYNTFPNLNILSLLYFTLIKRIKMVRPFYYIDYNKNEAKKIITEKYGWIDYGGHHHENIFTRYIIGVWLYQKFNIDKRKVTLSAYIRNNEISRENGLNQLEELPYSLELMIEDHEYVAKKLGLSNEEFDEIWEKSNKIFLDYPSYYGFYQSLKWATRYIFKFILPFKPMFSYDFEKKKN